MDLFAKGVISPVRAQLAPSATAIPRQIKPFTGNRFNPIPQDAFTLRFGKNRVEVKAERYSKEYGTLLKDASNAYSQARWDLYATGSEEASAKMEAQEASYRELTRNTDIYTGLQKLMRKKNLKKIHDPVLKRHIEVLAGSFSPKKPEFPKERALNDELSKDENVLVKHYNSFRTNMGTSENPAFIRADEASDILQNSTNPEEVRKVWEAVHEHGTHREDGKGPTVQESIVALVKKRNKLVEVYNSRPDKKKEKGAKHFDTYYSMMLNAYDIKEKDMLTLLDQVDKATAEPYRRLANKVDEIAMNRFGIDKDQARLPWFRSGNLKRYTDFDPNLYLKGKDPILLAEKTANLMGTSAQRIFDKSDLYSDENRKGKTEHAFCFNGDAPDNIKAIGNVDPKHQIEMENAFDTVFHEVLGHGLDAQDLNPKLPPQLLSHHSLVTEGNAMMMGELPTSEEWLTKVLELPAQQVKELSAKARLKSMTAVLTGIRSYLLQVDFERTMYQNPDQDLNKMYWDKYEKYFFIKHPPGREQKTDWDIIHFISHPGYYPNYLYGDLWRAQVKSHIDDNFGGLLNPQAGAYLKKHRSSGIVHDTKHLIKAMTGKPLNADAILREFKDFRLD